MAKNPQVKVKTFRTPKKTKERNEKWKKSEGNFLFLFRKLPMEIFSFFAFSLSFRNEVMNPPRPQATDTDADRDTKVSLAL